MNKKCHPENSIIHEVEHCSPEELKVLYNITIYEDGQVFDPTYNITFSSLAEWANFEADQDEDYGISEYTKHFHYDEDY